MVTNRKTGTREECRSGRMYAWLERAPLRRNEAGMWWRRHDEYDNE